MALVLQIVKHSDHRRATNEGSGKSRIEEHVDALLSYSKRKDQLLPQNSSRPKGRTYTLWRVQEIGLFRNQVRPRLTIGEHDVLIHRIDRGQCGQQIPQIDFSTADPSGDEI